MYIKFSCQVNLKIKLQFFVVIVSLYNNDNDITDMSCYLNAILSIQDMFHYINSIDWDWCNAVASH